MKEVSESSGFSWCHLILAMNVKNHKSTDARKQEKLGLITNSTADGNRW